MQHAQFRPLGAGQLVGQTVESYRRLFRQLIVPTCLLVVPGVALMAGIGIWAYLSLKNDNLLKITQRPALSVQLANGADGRIALVFAAAGLVVLLSMTLMSAVTSVVVSQGYLGGAPSWRRGMAVALRRLGSLLLVYLIVAVVMIALDLPSIFLSLAASSFGVTATNVLQLVNVVTTIMEAYLGVSFAILAAVVVLEGDSGVSALRRCVSLVRGRWWATLGTLLLVGLVQFVGLIAVSVVVGLAFSAVREPAAPAAVLGIAACLLFPLQAVAITLIYFDLRNRHGGFDVTDLASRIGTAPPPAWSSSPEGWTVSAGAPFPGPEPSVGWSQQRQPGPWGGAGDPGTSGPGPGAPQGPASRKWPAGPSGGGGLPGWPDGANSPGSAPSTDREGASRQERWPPPVPAPAGSADETVHDPGPDPGAASRQDEGEVADALRWPSISPKPSPKPRAGSRPIIRDSARTGLAEGELTTATSGPGDAALPEGGDLSQPETGPVVMDPPDPDGA